MAYFALVALLVALLVYCDAGAAGAEPRAVWWYCGRGDDVVRA